jgi:hypothetical protein
MEHHPEAEEKLIAKKLRKEPENARPVSWDGRLASTYGATWPIKTHARMKVTIQEYFSYVWMSAKPKMETT